MTTVDTVWGRRFRNEQFTKLQGRLVLPGGGQHGQHDNIVLKDEKNRLEAVLQDKVNTVNSAFNKCASYTCPSDRPYCPVTYMYDRCVAPTHKKERAC